MQGTRRISKRVVFASFLISLLVVSAAFVLTDGGGVRRVPRAAVMAVPTSAETKPRSLTPLPQRPVSAELKRLQARTMNNVEKIRGLTWLDDAGILTLSGWEYGARTRETAEIFGGDDLRLVGRLASAGGILPINIDVANLAASFTAVSASASYSPFDKRVLLVDKQKRSESLVTHEMTHALQDQHFDLTKLLLRRPYEFDRTEAAFAVVEGDAVSVQRRFEQGAQWERVKPDRIGKIEDERFASYRDEINLVFPPLLFETFIFRYRDGVRFVETVRRKNGQAAVDGLFKNPPVSSEQVLHPEKYFANEVPRDVNFEDAHLLNQNWYKSFSTPLGEIGMRGVLLAGVKASEAERAAAGWNGDRACLYESNADANRSLFAWKTAWDTERDATEFFTAYNNLMRDGRTAHNESNGKTEAVWREGDNLTFINQRGAEVIIFRGGKSDVEQAIESLN